MRCPFIDDEAVESESVGGDDEDDDVDKEIFQWCWPQPTCVSPNINQLSCRSFALNRVKKIANLIISFFYFILIWQNTT